MWSAGLMYTAGGVRSSGSGFQLVGCSPGGVSVWLNASLLWIMYGAVLGTSMPAITCSASDPPRCFAIKGPKSRGHNRVVELLQNREEGDCQGR
ncbi:hypothetical protein F2Q68_00035324 [Brassica cretica]|uniref:Uncharacterized protein n=1 Tax=Brassica cretica TaxID=69181 RepID=A0A8S9GW62_BRACR|nr:hypothetical protein F2Q68_00035324 [Brassica cretica]